MEIMRFEFIDKYYAERDKVHNIHEKYIQREEEARQALEALKLKYEQVISDSVKDGIDADDMLTELDQKIEEAEKLYERRKKERQEAVKTGTSIKFDDVIREWNEKFRPAYKKEVMEPIYEKLMRIKYDYIKSVLEYIDAVEHYENEKREVCAAFGYQRGIEYKLHSVTPDYIEKHKIFISGDDLRDLGRGKIPYSFKATYQVMEDDK